MKSTIVSSIPMAIDEQKIGIIPTGYRIPAATEENPIQTLLLSGAKYGLYTGNENNEWIYLPVDSMELANAICNDFCSALPEISINRRPAVFPLDGEVSAEDVASHYGSVYDEAMEKQIGWFKRLVSIADDEWQKFRQHRMISNLQRTAVDYLGLEREWRNAVTPSELMRCPACASTCIPNVVVCANCRCVLDAERFKSLQFAHEVPSGGNS